jgi:ATP-dependent RNA helicase DDX51/DBP6
VHQERVSNDSYSKELKETQEVGREERPKKKQKILSSHSEERENRMSEVEGVGGG